jgi:uncharacterized integral membrane protein
MAVGERSITDVLQDILGNVQDIVRSEVRLAKSEMVVELTKVKAAAPMLVAGSVAGLLAVLFLVWTIVYALAFVVPMWAAALIVAALLAIVGGMTLTAGLKLLKRVNPPERTIASVKENVQWAKQQVK